MNRIAMFFSEGYEEVEAIAVVDICRRCRLDIDMVSITEEKFVKSSHNILVGMDKTFSQVDFDEYDMLVLPGGLKGTQGLEAFEPLMEQIDRFNAEGKYIGAICAAPSIFGHRGILNGRRACCYPGFEPELTGAIVSEENVEVDGHVVTSRGMGTATDFGLAIGAIFCGQDKAEEIKKQVVYKQR